MLEDGRRPGFFSNIVENLKSEYSKSKEMQDSLKKFREEAQKLEESEALKEARRKFESIEGETSKGSNVIKEQISGIADKVKGVKEKLDDVEALKKASEIGNLFITKSNDSFVNDCQSTLLLYKSPGQLLYHNVGFQTQSRRSAGNTLKQVK